MVRPRMKMTMSCDHRAVDGAAVQAAAARQSQLLAVRAERLRAEFAAFAKPNFTINSHN